MISKRDSTRKSSNFNYLIADGALETEFGGLLTTKSGSTRGAQADLIDRAAIPSRDAAAAVHVSSFFHLPSSVPTYDNNDSVTQRLPAMVRQTPNLRA